MKTGKGGHGWIVALVLIAAVVFLVYSAGNKTASVVQVVPSGNTPVNSVTTDYLCTSPSFTIVANDKRTNLALTESNNIVHECNTQGGWRTWTQGTAITTLTPGHCYEFVPGISTTSFTANAAGGAFTVDQLPACGSMQTEVYNDATTFTGTYLNQNDAAAGLAFTKNVDATVSVKMQAAAKTTFGNPYLVNDPTLSDIGSHSKAYPNCACVQANSSWADTVNIGSSYNGITMSQIPVPTILTGATGKVNYCFESPVVQDIPTKQYFNMDIKETAADDYAIKFYPAGYFLDTSGVKRWGCETDAGAAVVASVVSVTGDVTP